MSDDNWAKLVWAGLNLTEPDLPCTEHGFLYPFQMLRALTMVWLFSGLRCDEMQRLRVGSVRWKSAETGEPRNAARKTCLLHVPVNKTSTAFVKPVDSLVGQEIEAWEKVRPEQPAMLDDKTGELVENRVKADVFETGDPFRFAEVVAVAVAKAQDGAPGAKHFFPEMREGMRGRRGINLDCLGRY